MLKKLKKIPNFLKEVKEEMGKVNWSTRQELVGAVIIVVVVSTILTSYISLLDMGFSKLLQNLLK